ncbi:aminomethyl-transferring glycine dehydrogenase subunit GcvPA [Pseudolysobacter antarcticus]|uniref:Probable glycine dehydrogenase (decarboxylating) subunit 1 n=1 Tax=Pseudolysobacter antarcticus TaxID=2511995 RepID=A0A411HG67_9GAMM|nr:aminomethyl-transferring glycine dehydrogenase subunit GcvPA [Pseudolysobacter antarcticus]QBB69493.1 aminomethyl-transferring glycine dehydrogenase subunit GcvPA [Pseudolysobacter antarcticus]
MPFIPHSNADVSAMLKTIGVDSIETLFDEIPAELKIPELTRVPPGLNEMDVTRLLKQRAAMDGTPLNFAGAGAYEHHIPAAVWAIVTRGEFYSAYTPYQAEASQGTLQLIYEYQTMITRLTGMDVANASLYDGATAVAEAVLMAERCTKKAPARVLVAKTLHPAYRKTLKTIVENQNIDVVELDFDLASGAISPAWLATQELGEFSALVIPQPNFFGVLEDVDALTDWVHAKGALAIAVVNPMSLAVLQSPAEWGASGADIVCGDGQPMGVPLSSGGPYFGILACKKEFVRQMPGRIVGRTTDLDGRDGYALTLQAREQHIRRAKATSNICTNQGLLVTAATIYMAITGPEGLQRVAANSMQNTRALREKLTAIPGVAALFSRPFFHEVVLQLNKPASEVIELLAKKNILAGVALGEEYPELGDVLLVCATETKTADDLDTFALALATTLA